MLECPYFLGEHKRHSHPGAISPSTFQQKLLGVSALKAVLLIVEWKCASAHFMSQTLTSMSPHDHGQMKLHKRNLTQKLCADIGKQQLTEVVARAMRQHNKRWQAGSHRSFAHVLLHAYVRPLSTACGQSQGSGAPPSARMQQSHNPHHLNYGDSFPTLMGVRPNAFHAVPRGLN